MVRSAVINVVRLSLLMNLENKEIHVKNVIKIKVKKE